MLVRACSSSILQPPSFCDLNKALRDLAHRELT